MNVKVILREKKAVVIEYLDEFGHIQRSVLPEESLVDGNTVRDELLSASIPYGVDWESHLEGVVGNVTSGMFADEFHKVGIWTSEDVMDNPKKVFGVVQTVYGIDYAGIINFAKSMLKK